MLMRILTEPRDAIMRQFQEIFRAEGVELIIEPAVVGQIADLAIEYKIGARSLRGIFEEMITPALFVVPDRKDIRKVVFRSLFEDVEFVCA
jgi:ATP-dependent Clp protease ATP-binding subunit ClpX